MLRHVECRVRRLWATSEETNPEVLSGSMNLSNKPSTPWSSRAVPQPSTDLALHRLAMEFEWDPAYSMQYGRRLINHAVH